MPNPVRPARRHVRTLLVAGAAALIVAGTTLAISKQDPGGDYYHQLQAQSQSLFGFGHPLDNEVATTSFDGPGDQAVELAAGLSARVVSSTVGENADMIALWPDDTNPTHAIVCNEINGTGAGSPATIQSVDLATGAVSNIAFGLNSCDPAHRTPWGTIIVGEEIGNTGRVYEILDPLNVHDVQINRVTGVTSDPAHIVARYALGQLAFEGIVILPDGTVYYGDERRPANGSAAGGIFKFVPATASSGGAAITDLANSPLAQGSVSVMRLGVRSGPVDYGQGSNTGGGRWVPIATPANPQTFDLDTLAKAATVGMTGFYRPEDMDLDPIAWAAGKIRACWNDTGNDAASNWGETLCLEDVPAASLPTGRQPVVEPFVIGNDHLRMPDNLDFQPGTGNLYILMDATTSAEDANRTNDQVWACLRDGADPDVLTDGCVRVMNLKDGEAEFTGIEFLGDGKSFLIHLQHRTQEGREVAHTTDEILVTGLH
jgi:secreted PhoX family phosphatase